MKVSIPPGYYVNLEMIKGSSSLQPLKHQEFRA